jgi:CheY-like chemotaxis protein
MLAEGDVMSPVGNAAIEILIVEDDALIRLAARDHMEATGFTVYDAYNASEAIELLEAHPHISLVFTDVDMPGSMDGVKLAHYVRERWPVRIIVTSGFKHFTPEQLPTGSLFLDKPYVPERLTEHIESLFSS